jgi:glycosyltransferase involved in cell wall biosynthesis
MNRKAERYLAEAFSIPKEKICFIPHGTPVPIREKREAVRSELGWTNRKVLMTFGLLSRGKGLETMLRALPAVVNAVPETLYAIVGQTHPEVKKREGEAYRQELQQLIRNEGLERNVVMVDRYLDEEELVRYLTACDLYVTPYPGVQQITSGTLAYAVGLGRPVLSTPYIYAQDLLSDYEELFLPFHDVSEWERKIIALLRDDNALRLWERRMERLGAGMRWPQVGRQHLKLFENVIRDASGIRQIMKA